MPTPPKRLGAEQAARTGRAARRRRRPPARRRWRRRRRPTGGWRSRGPCAAANQAAAAAGPAHGGPGRRRGRSAASAARTRAVAPSKKSNTSSPSAGRGGVPEARASRPGRPRACAAAHPNGHADVLHERSRRSQPGQDGTGASGSARAGAEEQRRRRRGGGRCAVRDPCARACHACGDDGACDRGLRGVHRRSATTRVTWPWTTRSRRRPSPARSCGSGSTSRPARSSRRCGVELGLHPLAVEDAIAAHQRPKLEVYDGDLFVVLKTARYDDAAETVELAELQLFVGTDLRGVGPPRRSAAPGRGARRALERDPDRRALRADGGAPRRDRPRRRRLRPGDRRASTTTWPRSRTPCSIRTAARVRPQPAHLQAEARGARPPPQHRAAPRARSPAWSPATSRWPSPG